MSVSELIAIGSLATAVIALLLNSRKGTRDEAASLARMDVKLGIIQNGIDDIRIEQRTVREQITKLSERVTACEAKIKIMEGLKSND